MRVGITGTRNLEHIGRDNIVAALAGLMQEEVEAVVVGGCVGADAFAGRTAKRLGFWVKAILPENPKEMDPHWEEYSDEAEGYYPYRERNTRIVNECDLILAFPDLPEAHKQSKFSGTWMTVRIAQKAGKPVRIFLQHHALDYRPPRGLKGQRQRALTAQDPPRLTEK